MGLVRKAEPDAVAAGKGSDDMAGIIRRSVADEIERQRRATQQRDEEAEAEGRQGAD